MVQREPYAKSISRCLPIGYSKHQRLCNNPTEYNWRSKVYHVSRAHPPPQSINLSPGRLNHRDSKRLLRRISEEFDLETTADEMTFVENNDFQQGSTSNEPQQRPQYYGSGLGDASFVEDDDDYEFLLDEALARDGLYRGMSL